MKGARAASGAAPSLEVTALLEEVTGTLGKLNRVFNKSKELAE